MSVITTTRLYELLTEKVGRETAEKLTTHIEAKIKEEQEDESKLPASKEDIVKVNKRITGVNITLIIWMLLLWIAQAVVTYALIKIFLNK